MSTWKMPQSAIVLITQMQQRHAQEAEQMLAIAKKDAGVPEGAKVALDPSGQFVEVDDSGEPVVEDEDLDIN